MRSSLITLHLRRVTSRPSISFVSLAYPVPLCAVLESDTRNMQYVLLI